MRKWGRKFCFWKKIGARLKILRTTVLIHKLFLNTFYYLALKVKFKGKANVCWTETEERSNNRQKVPYYHASETYFNTTVSLVGQGMVALV